ncbi:solute carrier family 26 member 6-like isoform X2 [Chelonus insularis]|uniref:solute carrier family 26 member 6-like isoform X2 n=1 Tax=Chelonus insularis TaxID=460826 RepID=UPI00158C6E7C|nr:solute carrier family 26 member 6-like isoform X2 [Chelonus insularis]
MEQDEKQPDLILRLRVDRPLYNQDTLNQEFYYEKPKFSLIKRVSNSLANKSCQSCITSMLPVIKWLKKYKWKEHIISDIISGITVAIMHIPQGMAYALLGNVPPVIGIYMAFFPVLIYFLLGTSKHVSMGTFAIVCLMTGKAVTSYSYSTDNLGINNTEMINTTSTQYSPMQVATAVTFTVGILQLMMFFLRLGIISTLLSETLVNGFTTGAAIHVLMSQIKDLFGLKLPKQQIDHFKVIFTTIDIFSVLNDPNFAAMIVSAVSIAIMIINDEFFKPWLKKKCNMPIPIELIAVVAGTLISNYCDLPGKYKIQTVGDIPTGLPKPELPTFQLLSIVAVDCIAITMVSYTVTLSMALIFAQKLQYDIDSNQELFAMGMSNVFGSFFFCMPVSASLSRSLIQQTVGGKTQIASIVSCSILLIILLWIGPFFEPLPRCVLASIIIVALKGMLLQAKQLRRFWKVSKLDGITWIVTFLVVVLVGIDIGLLFGLLTSLASILFLSIKSYSCLLGHVPNTDLYLDISRYKGTVELKGIKIFHYCGGLNFANRNNFKLRLFELVNVNPQKVLKKRMKKLKSITDDCNYDDDLEQKLRCIVMDLSALSYIDPSGITILHAISDEFASINIPIYLAGCSAPVFESILKCDKYAAGKHQFIIFVTIHDAVTYAKEIFAIS